MSEVAQTSIYEREIQDDQLQEFLETAQKQKEARAKANAKLRELKPLIDERIAAHELGDDATVRIGRFLLTRKTREGRSVAFETASTKFVQISLLPDA